MAKEIERKFLVNPSKLPAERYGDEYKQGYLSITDTGVTRIRIIGDRGFLTIKSKTIDITRDEYEYEIPFKDAARLIKLSQGKIIHKTRTRVVHDGKEWEIDEFHGDNKGLWLAEIELVDSNESFSKPEWVLDEVSDDQKYFNSNLTMNPFKSW